MSKHDIANVPSLLLGQHENDTIFSLLGRKCTVRQYLLLYIFTSLHFLHASMLCASHASFPLQTLSTAVVQVLHAQPESRNRWTKKCTGVACFVKDNGKRSYFIRVYNLMVSIKLNCFVRERLKIDLLSKLDILFLKD